MAKAAEQVAAIPMQWCEDGTLRILMITSRETGRWVLPKGWPVDGKAPWRSAAIEALEEAGVTGRIGREPLGVYDYDKRLPDGQTLRCRVQVYPMTVARLKPDWKERGERKRLWFSPKDAAQAVEEPGLVSLLMRLRKKPRKQPLIRALLRA